MCASVVACSDGSNPGGITGPTPTPQDTSTPPPIVREMRGLWIATVANIDWPSRTGLSADAQRAELNDILDRAVAAGLNTIIFHVRPAADAVYASSIEPWGAMLSGTQGINPGFDPLEYAVTQAHARGLELHAWVNPFRAGNTSDTLKLATNHVFNTHRDYVRVYASNIWLDPGEPAVRDYSMQVIKDIVARYDIDGIHADDYFYPYVVNDAAGKPIAFPDSATFARYGGALTLGDWRRANIDAFVQRMYNEVHVIKPTLKVGISPFGIWRPGNPAGVTGLDAYASIYADSRKWLQNGWVDYLAPQLYWAIASTGQPFGALLDWWIAQSAMGRHVWPGLAAYRYADGTTSSYTLSEVPDEIKLTRTRTAGTGTLLYNTTSTLKRNSGALATALASDVFRSPALVPASPWLDAVAPATPTLTMSSGSVLLLTPGSSEGPRWWVLRTHSGTTWKTQILFGTARNVMVDTSTDHAFLNAVDQAGNLSGAAEWRHPVA